MTNTVAATVSADLKREITSVCVFVAVTSIVVLAVGMLSTIASTIIICVAAIHSLAQAWKKRQKEKDVSLMWASAHSYFFILIPISLMVLRRL